MQAATRLHRTARGRFGIQPEGLCVKNCVMHMEFLGACCDFCLQIPELCLTFSTKNVKYFKNEVFKNARFCVYLFYITFPLLSCFI